MFNVTDHPCSTWLTQPVVFTSTQTNTPHPCEGSEAPREEWGWPAETLRASAFVPWRQHRPAGPFFPKPFCMSSSWTLCTLLNFKQLSTRSSALPQLLTQRAGPLSQPQSCYCPASMEALAAHNTEQLTNWEQPCRFLSFVFACGGMLLCVWK